MNKFLGIGNLTKDVELSYTTSADPLAVAKFTIAINEGYGEKQKVDYIPVIVFGKRAENCEKYLSKGSKVSINGKLKIENYQKDGNWRTSANVIAEEIEFL